MSVDWSALGASVLAVLIALLIWDFVVAGLIPTVSKV
jgi:hypothetical protein